jgi:eukaryotic-like serine/threonine-protein kinase
MIAGVRLRVVRRNAGGDVASVTSETTTNPRQPGYMVAGKYRVDRVLGEGGMGVVVAATHEQLDQKVALKFLLPEVAKHPDLVQRFMREARAAVKIHSEHVARVLDVGTHDGAPYMVMEYLEGADISQVLDQPGPLPIEDAIGYVLEACEAIAEAHSIGIIHRDLKPANLFLATRPSGRPSVKVLDFGISKAPTTGNDPNMTRTSELMGSPSYMSPEQMASASSVDARSDIWSLGVVLYEMLVKKLPFVADTMPGLVVAILQAPPEPLTSIRSDLPPNLQAVVERCLCKVPAQRFSNVAELARALLPFAPPRGEQSVERIEHVLGQKSSSRVPPVTRLQSNPPLAGVAGTFAPTTSQTPMRHTGVLIAAPIVVVAVAGIAALLFFALHRPMPAATPPPAIAAASTPAPSSPLPSAEVAAIAPSSAPSASAPATTVAPTAPRPIGRPNPTAMQAAAPPAVPTPACKTVSYFDADGNKHFKQVCP